MDHARPAAPAPYTASDSTSVLDEWTKTRPAPASRVVRGEAREVQDASIPVSTDVASMLNLLCEPDHRIVTAFVRSAAHVSEAVACVLTWKGSTETASCPTPPLRWTAATSVTGRRRGHACVMSS